MRLLVGHPRFAAASLNFYSRAKESDGDRKVALADLHPMLLDSRYADNPVEPFNWKSIEDAEIELLFLATPHEQSRELVPAALARGIRVIDLSGAWRLQDAANRSVYKLTDDDPELAARLQAEAVYGLQSCIAVRFQQPVWWRIPAAMQRPLFWLWLR